MFICHLTGLPFAVSYASVFGLRNDRRSAKLFTFFLYLRLNIEELFNYMPSIKITWNSFALLVPNAPALNVVFTGLVSE